MAVAYHRHPRAIGGMLRVVECDETCVNKRKRNPLSTWPRCVMVLGPPPFPLPPTCPDTTPAYFVSRTPLRSSGQKYQIDTLVDANIDGCGE